MTPSSQGAFMKLAIGCSLSPERIGNEVVEEPAVFYAGNSIGLKPDT